MSTTAQAILKEIKALTPEEQREILAGLEEIPRIDNASKIAQRAAIRRLRGMFAGARLGEALLASRAEECRRG